MVTLLYQYEGHIGIFDIKDVLVLPVLDFAVGDHDHSGLPWQEQAGRQIFRFRCRRTQ